MIYKEFIAETAREIVAQVLSAKNAEGLNVDTDEVQLYARGAVKAAHMLADELEADFDRRKAIDGVHRYSEGETLFDNYVNWTKTK